MVCRTGQENKNPERPFNPEPWTRKSYCWNGPRKRDGRAPRLIPDGQGAAVGVLPNDDSAPMLDAW